MPAFHFFLLQQECFVHNQWWHEARLEGVSPRKRSYTCGTDYAHTKSGFIGIKQLVIDTRLCTISIVYT